MAEAFRILPDDCPAHGETVAHHEETARRLHDLEEWRSDVDKGRLADYKEIITKIDAVSSQITMITGESKGRAKHLSEVVAILGVLAAIAAIVLKK